MGGIEVFLEKRRGDSVVKDCVNCSGLILERQGSISPVFFHG